MTAGLPRLTRTSYLTDAAGVRRWALADWPATWLTAVEGGWRFDAAGAMAGWMRRHDLLDLTFATRRGALQVFAATLAADPPANVSPGSWLDQRITADDPLKLRRVSAGLYRSADGLWEARKQTDASGWTVTTSQAGGRTPVPTLLQAQRQVILEARLLDRSDRQPLR